MALVPADSGERKRVKVYELRDNDWFDRGTGFCAGRVIGDESKILVESEDQPDRILLDTKIVKDDGYQKQQETLIVWTESNGVDMALSFQEAEGCAAIWEFVHNVQQHLISLAGPDDALSDGDMTDGFAQSQLVLPPPEVGNLEEIESAIRGVASTQHGRDALAKFVITEEYVRKLIPLVEIAEDLESLKDLHYLCNIMKMIILLNDSQIIDHIVNEDIVMGVVGALEYDPDFPNHKANHRRYLQNHSRYKEVINISDPNITKKIHATWRLTYLKDVVLARILDDPTFGVLNSLIFFNQVDIISYLQSNPHYLEQLFGIIDSPDASLKKKKDAVGFIQSCCAIAKSLQAPPRTQLYNNFINYGLLRVITFAILNREASIRVAGTDILVAMIDHDPSMVRAYILGSIRDGKTPLTETLIELLLVEVDLGVKAQAADAIKVLLEPQQIPPPQVQAQPQAQAQGQGQEGLARNGEFISKMRGNPTAVQQAENFIAHFYEHSANKLFKPLKDLEKRTTLNDLSFHDVQLFNHLVEIIIYLSRTHQLRSKYYIFSEGLGSRISQLLTAPQKHLRLTALKFFRQCVGLQDDHYNRQLVANRQFGPILNIVYDTMPRDNLLNSACLELFEYIRRESIKPLIRHLAEEYGDRLQEITYVDTFKAILNRYQQMMHPEGDMALYGPEGVITTPPNNQPSANASHNQRWQGVKEMDADEEAYFNTSDDEDELQDIQDNLANTKRPKSYVNLAPSDGNTSSINATSLSNGLATTSPLIKSLVNYPEDDEDDLMEVSTTASASRPSLAAHILPSSPSPSVELTSGPKLAPSPIPSDAPPPERLGEKRRRDDDSDSDDELGKLSAQSSANKRRNSGSGLGSSSTNASGSNHHGNGGGNVVRRKKSFLSASPSGDNSRSAVTTQSAGSTVSKSHTSPANNRRTPSGSGALGGSGGTTTSGSGVGAGGMKIEINLGGTGKAQAIGATAGPKDAFTGSNDGAADPEEQQAAPTVAAVSSPKHDPESTSRLGNSASPEQREALVASAPDSDRIVRDVTESSGGGRADGEG